MHIEKPKLYYIPIFVDHQIFVDEDQRYAIYEGEEVRTLGKLNQIEQFAKNGDKNQEIFTKEIFLEYRIDSNRKKEPIEVLPSFYKIHIPFPNLITNEDFDENDENFQNDYIEDLLNEEDGGRKRLTINFKKAYKLKKRNFVFIHNIEIKDYSFFDKSITFVNL
jgi:hypothetical protein